MQKDDFLCYHNMLSCCVFARLPAIIFAPQARHDHKNCVVASRLVIFEMTFLSLVKTYILQLFQNVFQIPAVKASHLGKSFSLIDVIHSEEAIG